MSQKKLRKLLIDARELLQMLDDLDVLRHSEGVDPTRPARTIERIDAYMVERGWQLPYEPTRVPDGPVLTTFSTAYVAPEWMRS